MAIRSSGEEVKIGAILEFLGVEGSQNVVSGIESIEKKRLKVLEKYAKKINDIIKSREDRRINSENALERINIEKSDKSAALIKMSVALEDKAAKQKKKILQSVAIQRDVINRKIADTEVTIRKESALTVNQQNKYISMLEKTNASRIRSISGIRARRKEIDDTVRSIKFEISKIKERKTATAAAARMRDVLNKKIVEMEYSIRGNSQLTRSEQNKYIAQLRAINVNRRRSVSGLRKEKEAIEAVNRAIKKQVVEMGILRRSLNKVREVGKRVVSALLVFQFINLIRRGFNALISGIRKVIGFIINATAKVELFSKQLEVMFKGAGRVKDIFKYLSEVTIRTPFEMEDIIQATISLKAFNLNIKNNMGAIADWAAAIGKDVNDTALAFAKIAAGSPRTALLLTTRGISKKDYDEELRRTDNAATALRNIISKRFKNMAEEMSKTYTGLASNIRDQLFLISSAVGKKTFDNTLKPIMEFIYNFLDKIRTSDQAIASLSTFFDKIMSIIVTVGSFLIGKGASYLLSFADKLGDNSGELKDFANALSYVGGNIKEIISAMSTGGNLDRFIKELEDAQIEAENIKDYQTELNAERQIQALTNYPNVRPLFLDSPLIGLFGKTSTLPEYPLITSGLSPERIKELAAAAKILLPLLKSLKEESKPTDYSGGGAGDNVPMKIEDFLDHLEDNLKRANLKERFGNLFDGSFDKIIPLSNESVIEDTVDKQIELIERIIVDKLNGREPVLSLGIGKSIPLNIDDNSLRVLLERLAELKKGLEGEPEFIGYMDELAKKISILRDIGKIEKDNPAFSGLADGIKDKIGNMKELVELAKTYISNIDLATVSEEDVLKTLGAQLALWKLIVGEQDKSQEKAILLALTVEDIESIMKDVLVQFAQFFQQILIATMGQDAQLNSLREQLAAERERLDIVRGIKTPLTEEEQQLARIRDIEAEINRYNKIRFAKLLTGIIAKIGTIIATKMIEAAIEKAITKEKEAQTFWDIAQQAIATSGASLLTAAAILAASAVLVAGVDAVFAAEGFSGRVNRPTMFIAGEGGEAEDVNITPVSRSRGSGSGNTIIIEGPVFNWEEFKDMTQKAGIEIRRGYA